MHAATTAKIKICWGLKTRSASSPVSELAQLSPYRVKKISNFKSARLFLSGVSQFRRNKDLKYKQTIENS